MNILFIYYLISRELHPAINPSDLGGIYVLQPKIEETGKVNILISKLQRLIKQFKNKAKDQSLEEYKKSLIIIVGRKADVRGVEI